MDFFDPAPLRTPVRTDPFTSRRPAVIRLLAYFVGVMIIIALLAYLNHYVRTKPQASTTPPSAATPMTASGALSRPAPPSTPLCFTFPTPRQHLTDTNTPGTFMPTVSGRVESALFGLVRTSSHGGPAFHEGIDIAPLARDRQGQPADPVYAVADGTVGYINRIAGNSNYGLYIVLLHHEPIGEFYTLYAHLARIEASLLAGTSIHAGDKLGLMGHTPANILPPGRGHLHFEIGLIQNSRFAQWYRTQKQTPDHGNFNGQNFIGLNPQALFCKWDNTHRFALLHYLQNTPPAFSLMIDARHPIDFFVRYPALWHGDTFRPGIVVMDVAEGGIPVVGRMATPAELAEAGTRLPPFVTRTSHAADIPAHRLITHGQNDIWHLSAAGTKWLEILLY